MELNLPFLPHVVPFQEPFPPFSFLPSQSQPALRNQKHELQYKIDVQIADSQEVRYTSKAEEPYRMCFEFIQWQVIN